MDAPENANASSFFHIYKELFEYERHVGSDDSVVLSQRDGIGAKTFLDKYRECEQRQAMEVRAGLQLPLVSTLMVDTMRTRGVQLSSTLMPFATAMTMPPPQQQQYQPERTNPQVMPPQRASSSFTRSKLENSLRQSVSDQEDATPVADSSWSASSYYNRAQFPERTSPHPHATAERQSSSFQLPKLADLLIDSSTRSATLRYKHLDEAKKVELLIGNNCGGRISSVSTNLPPSIRRRLQASVRVEQRREQLYSVLRQDYQELCHE